MKLIKDKKKYPKNVLHRTRLTLNKILKIGNRVTKITRESVNNFDKLNHGIENDIHQLVTVKTSFHKTNSDDLCCVIDNLAICRAEFMKQLILVNKDNFVHKKNSNKIILKKNNSNVMPNYKNLISTDTVEEINTTSKTDTVENLEGNKKINEYVIASITSIAKQLNNNNKNKLSPEISVLEVPIECKNIKSISKFDDNQKIANNIVIVALLKEEIENTNIKKIPKSGNQRKFKTTAWRAKCLDCSKGKSSRGRRKIETPKQDNEYTKQDNVTPKQDTESCSYKNKCIPDDPVVNHSSSSKLTENNLNNNVNKSVTIDESNNECCLCEKVTAEAIEELDNNLKYSNSVSSQEIKQDHKKSPKDNKSVKKSKSGNNCFKKCAISRTKIQAISSNSSNFQECLCNPCDSNNNLQSSDKQNQTCDNPFCYPLQQQNIDNGCCHSCWQQLYKKLLDQNNLYNEVAHKENVKKLVIKTKKRKKKKLPRKLSSRSIASKTSVNEKRNYNYNSTDVTDDNAENCIECTWRKDKANKEPHKSSICKKRPFEYVDIEYQLPFQNNTCGPPCRSYSRDKSIKPTQPGPIPDWVEAKRLRFKKNGLNNSEDSKMHHKSSMCNRSNCEQQQKCVKQICFEDELPPICSNHKALANRNKSQKCIPIKQYCKR